MHHFQATQAFKKFYILIHNLMKKKKKNSYLSQAKMKLSEEQLASLSSPKAVNQYLEHQKENITSLIKQNLAVGDIYRRENLQVPCLIKMCPLYIFAQIMLTTNYFPLSNKRWNECTNSM